MLSICGGRPFDSGPDHVLDPYVLRTGSCRGICQRSNPNLCIPVSAARPRVPISWIRLAFGGSPHGRPLCDRRSCFRRHYPFMNSAPRWSYATVRNGSTDVFPRTAIVAHLEQHRILFCCPRNPWNASLLKLQRCLIYLGMCSNVVIDIQLFAINQ